MRKMKTFKFTAVGGGSRAKYEWEKLLDGTTWNLSPTEMHPRKNEPPMTTIVRFRRTAHAAAKARGLQLQTEVIEGTRLVIQTRPVG